MNLILRQVRLKNDRRKRNPKHRALTCTLVSTWEQVGVEKRACQRVREKSQIKYRYQEKAHVNNQDNNEGRKK